MQIEWNLALKIGLAGLGVAFCLLIWLRKTHQLNASGAWLMWIGLLVAVSLIATIGSQVSVVTKFSYGSHDEPESD